MRNNGTLRYIYDCIRYVKHHIPYVSKIESDANSLTIKYGRYVIYTKVVNEVYAGIEIYDIEEVDRICENCDGKAEMRHLKIWNCVCDELTDNASYFTRVIKQFI